MGFLGILPVPVSTGSRTTPRTWVHPNPRRKSHRWWVDILKLKKRIPKYPQNLAHLPRSQIESKVKTGLQVVLVFRKLWNLKKWELFWVKKMFDMETRSLTMLERYIYRPKGTSHRHDTMMLEQCFEVTFWLWNSRQIIHQLAFTIPRCAKLSGESGANG